MRRYRIRRAGLEAAVRRLLARGRATRFAACAAVALASVVWLGVAMLVLRVLFFVALVLAALWCASVVAAVWWAPAEGREPPTLRALWARVRLLVARAERPTGQPDAQEAAFDAFRQAADALTAELLGRQERIHADGARVQRELATQIEAMSDIVARIAQVEQAVSQLTVDQRRAVVAADVVVPPQRIDVDVEEALADLEADLRLEKLEHREQQLNEREDRLDRRERQLAAFVEDAQTRLA
jgi:hypothetical protein